MELKANELRLGNWVYRKDIGDGHIRTESILEICNNRVICSGPFKVSCKLNDISPIPLTEEWLVRFGFEEFNSGIITSFNIDVTGITMANSETFSLSRNNDRIGYWYVYFRQGDAMDKELFHTNDLVLLQRKLMYVHQLQNLYFALTGEELELSPK